MTKQEAIRVLESMKSEESYNALIDLCNMAIESLQKDNEKHLDIVRCKDCKHGQYDATHYFCVEHGHKVYGDDYCSYGQRLSNFGELVEKVECSKCNHKEACEDAYTENSQYCNGEPVEQIEVKEITDKDEVDRLNKTFNHDSDKWYDITDMLKDKSHGRLIDADALKDSFLKYYDYSDRLSKETSTLIDNAPTIEIGKTKYKLIDDINIEIDEESYEIGYTHGQLSGRPHGEWLVEDEPLAPYICSVCKSRFFDETDFCPNCGAIMKDGEDG